MKYRNYRIRKPDPLLALAIVVGIGVVVTTTAQAESMSPHARSMAKLQETSARLALQPMKGLADNLEIHWLNSALDRPAVQQLVLDNQMELAKPFGRKGPQLGLSLRPDLSVGAYGSGDSGIGLTEEDRPDFYFTLSRSW